MAPTLVERMTSSKRQNYRTPKMLLGLISQLGPIAFDPTTTVGNPCGARRWATTRGLFVDRSAGGELEPYRASGADGMRVSWSEQMRVAIRDGAPQISLIYSNPTYKHLARPVPRHTRSWTEKIHHECGELVGGGMLVLVPSRVETAWFRMLMSTASRRLDWGSPTHGSRLKFEGGAVHDSALFPVTLFFWSNQRPMIERFERVFAPHGTLIVPSACLLPEFRTKAAEGRAGGVAASGSTRPSVALARGAR